MATNCRFLFLCGAVFYACMYNRRGLIIANSILDRAFVPHPVGEAGQIDWAYFPAKTLDTSIVRG